MVISKHHVEIPANKIGTIKQEGLEDKLEIIHPLSDYTPPELITLIFTDLGTTPPNLLRPRYLHPLRRL